MTDKSLPPDLRFVVFVCGVMTAFLIGMCVLGVIALVSGCRLNAELHDPRRPAPTAVKRPVTLPRTDRGEKP